MKILLSILFLFTVFQSYSQRFEAEITAGLGGSQISGDELGGFNKAGLVAGGGVLTRLDEKWDMGFQILYIQKGSRKPSKLDQGDPTFYLLRLNYVEIPLQFRYRLGIKKFYAEAGPSLGYLIGSSEEDMDGEMPGRLAFNEFDISFMGSLGYPIGNNWDFRFTYLQSILPVREHQGGIVDRLNRGQYNTMIAFTFSYVFKSNRSNSNP